MTLEDPAKRQVMNCLGSEFLLQFPARSNVGIINHILHLLPVHVKLLDPLADLPAKLMSLRLR